MPIRRQSRPLSDTHTVIPAIRSALAEAARCHQRRLVVLSGSRDWCRGVLAQLLARWQFADAVRVGSVTAEDAASVALPVIAPEKSGALLGHTLDLVVYDGWSGLNPDALAAVAGAVGGGGLLILCAPPLSQWPDFPDPDYRRMLVHPYVIEEIAGRFLCHLVGAIQSDSSVRLIEEGKAVDSAVGLETSSETAVSAAGLSLTALAPRGTQDQQHAVAAIIHVLEGHSRRPLVMTSDRGRGKSAALGIASARIMRSGCRQLVITAPRPEAVAPVFYHAALELGMEPPSSHIDHIEFGGAHLRFVAPDQLLRDPVAADLLMIDEAAAIPAALLQELAQRYNRTVFSTTVHGYEGTGRGFEIRFKKSLRQISNQVRELSLCEPIRWAADDPVERWLFRALLLDAGPAQLDAGEVAAADCIVEAIDRDLLLGQPDTLRELFGLLVLAHYRTTPSDLRNLLDGPNVSVWLSRYRGKVVAAALVAEEGGFDAGLAEAVWRGERRPHGHLLAQTLAAHAGLQGAPQLRYWRVMRIAVHPRLQRRSLGQQLLETIGNAARAQGIDLFGSSFAATADVVAFWNSAGCLPVRLGATRDASSGCHSALVLSACSDVGRELLASARARFAEQFPRDLEQRFAGLEGELVLSLLSGLPVFSGYDMGRQDRLDISRFVAGGRQYADCRLALWKLVLAGTGSGIIGECLAPGQVQLLFAVVLQCRRERAVCDRFGIDGKKALQRELRKAVGGLAEALVIV